MVDATNSFDLHELAELLRTVATAEARADAAAARARAADLISIAGRWPCVGDLRAGRLSARRPMRQSQRVVILLSAFGIVLLGAFAQAVSGFGYALVTVPLLAVAVDPRAAVVVSALTGIGLTVTAAVRERAHARWRVAAALTATALLGLPAGLLVLALAPERLLSALIAVVVLGCAALVWSGARIRTGRIGLGAIGVLVGVLTAATGTNGPPLVAAFQSLGYDPRTFRATLAATFSGTSLIGLTGFLLAGQVHADVVRISLVALPAVPLGWWLGNRLFHRIDPVVFRRIVLVGLFGSGGAALASMAG